VADFGAADLRQLSEHVRRLGAAAQQARDDLGERDLIGISPDGLVRATMRSSRLVGLSIDPSGLDLEADTLARQVLAAVQDAEAQVAEQVTRQLGPMTEQVEGLLRDYGG
jgi:DNA-binding protein YbaB